VKRSIWTIIAIIGTVAWLTLMVAASYFGYEHRLPVRIPNWQPETLR
jgi:hypothetical protein